MPMNAVIFHLLFLFLGLVSVFFLRYLAGTVIAGAAVLLALRTLVLRGSKLEAFRNLVESFAAVWRGAIHFGELFMRDLRLSSIAALFLGAGLGILLTWRRRWNSSES